MLRHLTLDGWRIQYDREATQAAYAVVATGGPESCGCVLCQNWVRVRDQVCPDGVRDILNELGIKHGYEAEVYQAAKVEDGHLYCGWYHFIGHVEEKPEPDGSLFIAPFTICFREHSQAAHEVFRDRQVVALEFNAVVPWLLDQPEPE
jgi:hypothetical protein